MGDINFTSPSTEFGPLQFLAAFIHISDIHAVHGDAAWQLDQEMVLNELLKDLSELVDRGLPPANFIMLSGDIGARGGRDPKEYRRARDFINRLRTASQLGKRGVVLTVPGNHDVFRTTSLDKDAFRLVQSLRRGRASVDEAFGKRVKAAALYKRFKSYRTFARRLMPSVRGNLLLAWAHEIRLLRGLVVEIIGLNTALLCNDDQDRQKLRLGATQIKTVQGDANQDHLRMVMMHHPPSWLIKDEENEFSGWLFRYAKFHLYGHVHNASANSSRTTTGDQLLTLIAGAAHNERSRHSDKARHAYNIVLLFAASDGRVIVRIFPRVFYGQKKFRVDSELTKPDQIFSEFPLPHRLSSGERGAQKKANSGFNSLARTLVERIGRRRTAFPLDLSIRELAKRNLLVPTPLVNRADATSSRRRNIADVIKCLSRRENVLILGSPGGGKTVLSFEAARAIAERAKALPLVVDLRMTPANSIIRSSLTNLLRQLLKGTKPRPEVSRSSVDKAVIIIDGLDERLAAGETAYDVSRLLVAMGRLAPILVTCRSEDYDRNLAAAVPGDLFDNILAIQHWSHGVEFRDFINRLAAASLVDATTVMRVVSEDPKIQMLVERPLFARMLTYVLKEGPPPASRTALYRSYLSKLGQTTDARLREACCHTSHLATTLWRDVAADIFSQHLRSADDMPVPHLLSLLAERGINANCAYRLLSAIMDIESAGGRLSAAFVHYSFFEFLVADHLALKLERFYPANTKKAINLLTRHIPQEIRRHLIHIVRESVPDRTQWLSWLIRLYKTARCLPDKERFTACNMIAYLACRLDVPAAPHLRMILTSETSPFLVNSLSWALARLNDANATWKWLERLDRDHALASLNRGYLLYYLGDLNRSGPPYYDDSPYIDCKNARSKLFAKLKDVTTERAVARRAVDLYSYLDLLASRKLKQSADEVAITQKFLKTLNPELPEKVKRILLKKLANTR